MYLTLCYPPYLRRIELKFETDMLVGTPTHYAMAKFVSFGGVIFTFVVIATSTDFYPARYGTTTLELSNIAIAFAVFLHLVFILLFLISIFWIRRTPVIIGANSLDRNGSELLNFDQVEKFRIEKLNLREDLYSLTTKLQTGRLLKLNIFLEQEQKNNLITWMGKGKITWESLT